MAVLTLPKLWVNRLDTGAGVGAYTSNGRPRQHAVKGEVRTYAGGRQRSILSVGEVSSFQFSMVDVSAADIELLRAWKGLTVVVRDHRGQRYFGVYYEVNITEQKVLTYDIEITLRFVDADEGV